MSNQKFRYETLQLHAGQEVEGTTKSRAVPISGKKKERKTSSSSSSASSLLMSPSPPLGVFFFSLLSPFRIAALAVAAGLPFNAALPQRGNFYKSSQGEKHRGNSSRAGHCVFSFGREKNNIAARRLCLHRSNIFPRTDVGVYFYCSQLHCSKALGRDKRNGGPPMPQSLALSHISRPIYASRRESRRGPVRQRGASNIPLSKHGSCWAL